MKIDIKKFEQTEIMAVKRLVKMHFEEDNLLSILNSNQLKFAYSAHYKHKIVGFMMG